VQSGALAPAGLGALGSRRIGQERPTCDPQCTRCWICHVMQDTPDHSVHKIGDRTSVSEFQTAQRTLLGYIRAQECHISLKSALPHCQSWTCINILHRALIIPPLLLSLSHACSARTAECNALSGLATDAAEGTPATPQTDQLNAACGRPSKKPSTVERAWQSIDMEPYRCLNPHLSGKNMSTCRPCCKTHHFLMTTPWRRVARATFSSSDSEEHSLPSEYPHRLPPQSSLTRLPARVMP